MCTCWCLCLSVITCIWFVSMYSSDVSDYVSSDTCIHMVDSIHDCQKQKKKTQKLLEEGSLSLELLSLKTICVECSAGVEPGAVWDETHCHDIEVNKPEVFPLRIDIFFFYIQQLCINIDAVSPAPKWSQATHILCALLSQTGNEIWRKSPCRRDQLVELQWKHPIPSSLCQNYAEICNYGKFNYFFIFCS